jgi:hypothetical protein
MFWPRTQVVDLRAHSLFGNRVASNLFEVSRARERMEGNVTPLIYIVLVLIVVGMGLWLINTYIPMARGINRILNVVVVVFTAIWVLKAFGLWNQVVNYKIMH